MTVEATASVDVAQMLDALPERVVRYQMDDLRVTYCNSAWAAAHESTAVAVIGHTLDEFLSPAEMICLNDQLARFDPSNLIITDPEARPAPGPPGRWLEWVDQFLPDDSGAVDVLSVGRDITDRYLVEARLAASEARFRDLADKSIDVVWRFLSTPEPHFDYLSPSVQTALGYPPSLFLNDFGRFLDVLDDDGRRAVQTALTGLALPARCDLRFRRRDGIEVIGEMQVTPIPDGSQGVGRDVTELRTLQDHLASLALRDPLTGLANRRLLNDLMSSSLRRALNAGLTMGVAFIDLDDFKSINDQYGHEAGDTVLCAIANRLVSTVRIGDIVARLGGDEFVIVYQAGHSTERNVLRRIGRAIEPPIGLRHDVSIRCSASVGYIDTRAVGYDMHRLLGAADTEMYAAKRRRRDGQARP
ncbi:MAG: domain S-box/diguanylate cyclase protein [Ilumatobacteraceae bacterium]|nr:domain S-box/diguanylate cyclase protein [Ilumatobacteraceae bacterium]MCU1391436.1 domain S-box/diguanylate cyclase protein [Ilumatobacteraceae bacterium]